MKKIIIISFLIMFVAPQLANAKAWNWIRWIGHHDYSITFSAKDGSYDTAYFKIKTKLKHPGATAEVIFKHEVWRADYREVSLPYKKDAETFMDDYGEISHNYTVPLKELFSTDAREYPTGIFVIEITDGHSTHTYLVGYERDRRYIKFRGSVLYCNMKKYWGKWEHELVPKDDSEIYCQSVSRW
jgi:hypothetical protein